jgi:capsid portal protein
MPVSDVAAKDEFFNVKGVTRDDVLWPPTAYRLN